MEPQIDLEVVGKEFDKWLDWNGTADEVNDTSMYSARPMITTSHPISPVSTNSDSVTGNNRTTSHTAHLHGLPTPANSSSSPETLLHTYRLSGETLRSDVSSMSQNSLKRKLSPNDGSEQEYRQVAGRPTGSKRPHNVIEKRYRANLNEKIAELRDSVPALRVFRKSRGKKDVQLSSDEEDLDGLAPSNKLNKASVLTKAVEYIRHLEFRTRKLEEENQTLKDRLHVLDKVLADGGNDAARVSAFTSATVIEPSPEPVNAANTAGEPRPEVKGLIGLPESMQRLRENVPREHYAHIYTTPAERSRLSGKWPQRIMLGSLAGLMVMEGLSESDTASESQKKALFGIPLEILDGWTFLSSPRVYLTTFVQYCRAGGVLPLAKGFFALTVLAFLVFYYMFNSKPNSDKEEQEHTTVPQAARPASPIEVRRRAWSTSMQALGLPHHSFFPEWFAVTSEWVNYTIRYWLGPQACMWICGETAEDESARIKAWDIAIDAQLAGGDMEVSRSRSVLTIFGSGTLPATPQRLMLKAIHTKLVLHNIGLAGSLGSKIATRIGSLIADRQWRRARLIHERLPARDQDRLPGYLNYLLQMDCDDVLSTTVTQRAYNMMYDRPTFEYADDGLMDVVVEDHAIRSPLDAIAAWRSTSAMHEALTTALQSPEATDLLREHVQSALEIAPSGSAAETRALAVHAVLSPGRRRTFYLRASEAVNSEMMPLNTADERVPYFIDSSTPNSARPEIATCLSCAEAMLKLENEQDLAAATEALSTLQWPELGMTFVGSTITPTMLSIAPIFFVLTRLLRASRKASDCSAFDCVDNVHPLPQMTSLAQDLYHTLRNEAAKLNSSIEGTQKCHLTPALDLLCSTWDMRSSNPLSRRQSNASHDTGYGSLEEEEHMEQGPAHKKRACARTYSCGRQLPSNEVDILAVSV